MPRRLLTAAARPRRRLRTSGRFVAVTLAVLVGCAALIPGEHAQAQGPGGQALHHPGVEVSELASLIGGPGRSLWTVAEGRAIGYLFGAPSFANQAFLDAFPGGVIPQGEPVFVVVPDGLQPFLPSVSEGVPSSEGELMITAISSGLSPGEHATLTVQSRPGVLCLLHYRAPRDGEAERLEAQRADAGGAVFWSWRIDERTEPGMASVSVACPGETVQGSIDVR